MLICTVKGDFNKSRKFLKKACRLDYKSLLIPYAEEGVEALAAATPVRTGKTAASWSYEIVAEANRFSIFWKNSNMNEGVPIAVILEYGHGTGWGGYVQGRHYIAPAIQPIFDKMAEAIQKEASKS